MLNIVKIICILKKSFLYITKIYILKNVITTLCFLVNEYIVQDISKVHSLQFPGF